MQQDHWCKTILLSEEQKPYFCQASLLVVNASLAENFLLQISWEKVFHSNLRICSTLTWVYGANELSLRVDNLVLQNRKTPYCLWGAFIPCTRLMTPPSRKQMKIYVRSCSVELFNTIRKWSTWPILWLIEVSLEKWPIILFESAYDIPDTLAKHLPGKWNASGWIPSTGVWLLDYLTPGFSIGLSAFEQWNKQFGGNTNSLLFWNPMALQFSLELVVVRINRVVHGFIIRSTMLPKVSFPLDLRSRHCH